jgi:hypothetical protein
MEDQRLLALRCMPQIMANIAVLITLIDSPVDDVSEMFHEEVVRALDQAQRLLDATNSADLPGRGRVSIGYRLPMLLMPKSDLYELHVAMPDRFQALCTFTPSEFEDLHNDVLDVLMLTRNLDGVYTEEENKMRKKRRFKYSSRERLFNFLCYMVSYRSLRKESLADGLSICALSVESRWLRSQLVDHPILAEEVKWPTPEEMEKERQLNVQSGLLPAGFENCVFICDGTKDLLRRMAHYNRTHEPDYSQKGNGKSHLLVAHAA